MNNSLTPIDQKNNKVWTEFSYKIGCSLRLQMHSIK